MTSGFAPTDTWSPHDSALWYTCEIAADLAAGSPVLPRLNVSAPFPPAPPDQQFWATGPFQLLDYRALGDGSYLHNGSFFLATGPIGIAASAVHLAGRAVGNSGRKKAAARDAVPRWVPIAHGGLYLSRHGFIMQPGAQLWHWAYSALHSAEMVDRGVVQFHGNSTTGPVNWTLVSDWAELLFVTWALQHHPRHPQLVDGEWLPDAWLQRCKDLSSATRLGSARLHALG